MKNISKHQPAPQPVAEVSPNDGATRRALQLFLSFFSTLPEGWLGRTTADVGLLNQAYLAARAAGALVPSRQRGNDTFVLREPQKVRITFLPAGTRTVTLLRVGYVCDLVATNSDASLVKLKHSLGELWLPRGNVEVVR